MEEKRETIVAGQATGKRTESGNNVHNADGTFGSGEGNGNESVENGTFESILSIGGIDDIDWDQIDDNEFSYLNDLLKPGGNYNRVEEDHNIEKDCLANPNRGNINYKNNCTHCVVAYELRRRGYDVIATGIKPGDTLPRTGYARTFIENDGSYMKKHTFKAQRKETLYNEIIEELSKIPNGRFIFRCLWSPFSGHVFSFEMENGEFNFIESQSNYSKTGEEAKEFLKYYIYDSMPSSWEMYRVDTCEPNWDLIEKETVVKNKNS